MAIRMFAVMEDMDADRLIYPQIGYLFHSERMWNTYHLSQFDPRSKCVRTTLINPLYWQVLVEMSHSQVGVHRERHLEMEVRLSLADRERQEGVARGLVNQMRDLSRGCIFDGGVSSNEEEIGMSSFQRRLCEDQVEQLMKFLDYDEIRSVVFSMSLFKAPGPDGCQAFFYQKYWDIVGHSMWEFVYSVLHKGYMEEGVGDSFMVLIPKVERPDMISTFRPISLCNVAYKVITKTITSRLRNMMKDLISLFQNSFILERGTHDNILIIQELIHTLKKSKSKEGGMVLDLTLRKHMIG
ncbi:hypothetical protein BUALT_Bualt03G0150300 [Buddleja alternifolia]|uniref:Reverse transcriptase domain-containing protein n=1 Tax=Buddleja alternifolia TaxID=168488 RepID=A0AAV6Y4Q6_9LAMI|nr:hypothetical protein BUALT_Bualt03G0150300 [Buddleja alternifolia]